MPAEPAPEAALERTVVAGRRRPLVRAADLWRYRDLLYFLTRRHVLARYKQTVLGVLWAVLQPFAAMVVFSLFLGALAGVPSDGIPYPVFAYLGLLPWQLFSGTVGRTSGSIVGSAHLISQVYFPRVLIPVASTLAGLVDFALAFVVLFGIMAFHATPPGLTILLVPVVVLLVAIVGTGIGMGLAALNVRYRDVSYVTPYLLQLWMFVTPVVYPVSLVPEGWRLVYALNPMTGLIQAHRDLALGRPLDLPVLAVSTAVGLLLAFLGARLFARTERRFADVV